MVWNYFFFILFTLSIFPLVFLFCVEESFLLSMNTNFLSPMSFMFCLDDISSTFLLMTLFVSGTVYYFSLSYMMEDQRKKGFMIILLLFSMSMIILVISGNVLTLMLGWDGLGITSLCLIIFFQNWSSMNSGVITFMTNRIGDTALVVSLVVLTISHGSAFFYDVGFSLLLLLGGMTKSAQLPFSSWLPRAMAAPTPVSALVHSSTLVTAGVFLVSRFFSFFSEDVLLVLQVSSVITIILAGSSSLGEVDLKKIIALSTLSHISLILFTMSIGAISVGLIHMIIHAVFKSSLFMISGEIIHLSQGEQDIRILSARSVEPGICFSLLFCTLSMAGAPFLAGFLSKEFILSVSSGGGQLWSLLFFLVGASLTGSYSVRILFSLMSKSEKASVVTGSSGVSLFFTLCSLNSAFISGLVISFISDGQNLMFSLVSKESKMLILFFLLLGVYIGYLSSQVKNLNFSLFKFFSGMWLISSVNDFIVFFVRFMSWLTMFFIDVKGHLDYSLLSSGFSMWKKSFLMGMFFYSPMSISKISLHFSVFILVLLM